MYFYYVVSCTKFLKYFKFWRSRTTLSFMKMGFEFAGTTKNESTKRFTSLATVLVSLIRSIKLMS